MGTTIVLYITDHVSLDFSTILTRGVNGYPVIELRGHIFRPSEKNVPTGYLKTMLSPYWTMEYACKPFKNLNSLYIYYCHHIKYPYFEEFGHKKLRFFLKAMMFTIYRKRHFGFN